MTTGQIVVIALRLIVPLLILKRPLLGGLLALGFDALDVLIVAWFGPGGMGPHYHNIDKALDLSYLSLEAWVSLMDRTAPAPDEQLALRLPPHRRGHLRAPRRSLAPLRLSQPLRKLVPLLPLP